MSTSLFHYIILNGKVFVAQTSSRHRERSSQDKMASKAPALETLGMAAHVGGILSHLTFSVGFLHQPWKVLWLWLDLLPIDLFLV